MNLDKKFNNEYKFNFKTLDQNELIKVKGGASSVKERAGQLFKNGFGKFDL